MMFFMALDIFQLHSESVDSSFSGFATTKQPPLPQAPKHHLAHFIVPCRPCRNVGFLAKGRESSAGLARPDKEQ